ncbi:MAG: hypothetical protein F4017_03235 [Acidimicrobiaceae bacterium]|nr:hypothetical protein [Acidimicrobiaceae bacterium]MYK73597.1 hypothetical protein [Acidimicrobiaceae bacterium]
MSLWVVLLCPVSAFAAVVANAVPQRLGAESALQDAADDLAVFAVAWRDGTGADGAFPAFPPDCFLEQRAEPGRYRRLNLDVLERRIDSLSDTSGPNNPPPDKPSDENNFKRRRRFVREWWEKLREVFPEMLPPWDREPIENKADLTERFDRLHAWEQACVLLGEALARDLGYQGIDIGALSGFYSDSLNKADLRATAPGPPCRVSAAAAGRSEVLVVRDAAHMTLIAEWQAPNWAASQLWPDGITMAAESIGRFSRFEDAAEAGDPDVCGDKRFAIHDSRGLPAWPTSSEFGDSSRQLVQRVQRFPLAG